MKRRVRQPAPTKRKPKAALFEYLVTLPNGKTITIQATMPKEAKRIAAEYQMIPVDKRHLMDVKTLSRIFLD